MATIVDTRGRRLPSPAGAVAALPVWVAVVLSRLLVLAAGSAGALFTRRLDGWQAFDPQRLSESLGSVGNVLGAASVRWDAVGYISVAQHGYRDAGSTVLFPLYPLLIRIAMTVTGSPVVAGVLISVCAFGVGLLLLHRLTTEELGPRVADTTVLLLAFAPWSFVFSAAYATSLLFALAVASFHLARRGRFVAACAMAACAATTHVQGILLVAPLALIYLRSRRVSGLRGLSLLRRLWSAELLALALPPLALAAFFLYMHAQGWGLLAPIANQDMAHAGRSLVGPPLTLLYSVTDAVRGLRETFDGTAPATGGLAPGYQNIIYLVVFGITILALVSTWRRLPREYALFATLALLVCSSSAVTMEPLKGFDRYMLPVFPLWIGAAAWLSERRLTSAVLMVSTALLAIYTVEFTRWVSVF